MQAAAAAAVQAASLGLAEGVAAGFMPAMLAMLFGPVSWRGAMGSRGKIAA